VRQSLRFITLSFITILSLNSKTENTLVLKQVESDIVFAYIPPNIQKHFLSIQEILEENSLLENNDTDAFYDMCNILEYGSKIISYRTALSAVQDALTILERSYDLFIYKKTTQSSYQPIVDSLQEYKESLSNNESTITIGSEGIKIAQNIKSTKNDSYTINLSHQDITQLLSLFRQKIYRAPRSSDGQDLPPAHSDLLDVLHLDSKSINTQDLNVCGNAEINGSLNVCGEIILNSLDLEMEIENLTSCCDFHESRFDILESEVDVLESCCDAQDSRLDTLESEIDNIIINSVVDRVARSCCDALGSRLDVVDSETDILESCCDAHDSRLNVIDSEIDMLESCCDIQDSRLDVLESEVDILESCCDAHGSRLDIVESCCDAQDSRLDVVDSEIDILESCCDAQDSRLDVIDSEVDILESCCDSQNSRLDVLESQIDGVITGSIIDKVARSCCDALDSRLDVVDSEIDILESCCDAQDSQLDVIDSKIDILESCCDAQDSRLDVVDSEIDILESCCDAQDSRFDVIDSQVDILESCCDAQDSRLDVIDSKIDILESCCDAQDSRFDVVDSEIDILESCCDAQDSRLDVIDSQVDILESCCDAQDSRFDVFDSRFDSLVSNELVFTSRDMDRRKSDNPTTTFTDVYGTGNLNPVLKVWLMGSTTATMESRRQPMSIQFKIPDNFDSSGSVEVDIHLLIDDLGGGSTGDTARLRLRADFKANNEELGTSTGGFDEDKESADFTITEPTIATTLNHQRVTITLTDSVVDMIAPNDWAFMAIDRVLPSTGTEYDDEIFLSSVSFRYSKK